MTFKELYKKEILPNIKKELKIKNYMDLPRLEKIVLNI
jgi:ribosomal protein L5